MAKFSFEKHEKTGIQILHLRGDVDTHTAPDFEQMFRELVEADTFRIVASFRELQYISSAGLNILATYIEKARLCGGDIIIADTTPRIYHIFDLLGYPHLYHFYDTIEAAVGFFANPPDERGMP